VSGGAIADAGAYQTFLSLFTLGRTVAYLGIQTFITQRLIANLPLKDLFLIQPVSSLLGASTMLAAPGLGGAIAGLSLQKLPQYSIDETARKAFAGLVPEERRGRVSLFLDSYLVSLGSILGALITGTILLMGRLGWGDRLPSHLLYLGVAGLMALLSLWAVLQMRAVYDKSLLNWRLKRRQRRFPLAIFARTGAAVFGTRQALALFAAGLSAGRNGQPRPLHRPVGKLDFCLHAYP